MTSATSKAHWRETANSKREDRESKVPSQWRIPASQLPPSDRRFVEHWPQESGLLTPNELQVTESTASEVVRRIASRQWTSEQVTSAVCKRAAIAQQLVNCTTEIFFDEAISRARKLDKYLRETGDVVGPLHGLPISLKDQFDIKGLDSTIGYVSRVGLPSTEDAALVTLLQNAGAVLYVKTNVPATLMMGETINYLFGPTVNPRNRALTPGGSSGGESALLALRGSFLGVGTDIGGSIRNPCAWTGLYGLRPSVGRVPCRGVTTSFAGQEAIRSTAGPMCRHPADIRLFMSTVAGGAPWQHDPDVLPIPWRAAEEELPRMICFGIAWHDGHVQPAPPIRRALQNTKAKLLAAGHKVIDFTPAENAAANRIAYKMWSADGGLDVQRATEETGEPLPERVETWMGKGARLQPLTTSQMWEIQKQRTTLAGEWLDRWNRTAGETGTGRPIDGLIMPSAAFPAPRHESGFPWTYSALAPLLDLTTGVFPVSKVDLGKDVIPDDWTPLSKKDTEVREFYGKPENHENALVGLALVGRRLEEEKVTAMLQVLHDTVGTDYEHGDDWDELKGSPVSQPKL